jgi:hypothetical protein
MALVLASLAGCNSLGGTLTATQSQAGNFRFAPTRCTASTGMLILSSSADPLRYVMLVREDVPDAAGGDVPATPSILAAQSGQAPPMRLTVLDLASRSGAPVVVESRACANLTMQASPSFSTRINNGPWVVSYSGAADIDCDGHRLVGHFTFTCPEE